MHLPLQRTGDSLSHPVQGDHAVVLGASMSGLLAARVLADHFAQVTVVERDRLAPDGRPRKGVPQARHAHALLSRGSEIIEGLFPGFLGDLVAVGVPVGESLDQFHYEVGGHVFFHERGAHVVRRGEGEQRMYQPSRPFLEGAVLRRVRALPNVDVLDGYDVEALTTNRAKTRVTGARIVPRDAAAPGPRDVAADLVVAATGRSGRAAAWLKGMGYATPPEDEVEVDLKYVSQRVRFPAGSVDHLRALLVGPTSRRPAGAGALEQEDNHWIVTLYGYGADHHPPLDREAWLAFGDTLLPSDFADALHESQPLEDAHQHRFAANLRRHYEKLGRFPEGFLVTGDALCSVNPVYGQGMTLAGLEVLALRGALRGGWDRLAPRFFGSAAKPIGTAWSFAVGGDLSLPSETVRGPRPVPVRAVNSYVDHFQAAAENDPVMAWRFLDVVGFEQPPAALFAPDSLRRLAADSRHHRRTGSASELAMAAAKGWTWP